jgi:hypothetical protein
MAAEELGIPGLRLLLDFVSEQEERELLAALERQPWHSLAKRRVQHYGFKFDYTVRAAPADAARGAAACLLAGGAGALATRRPDDRRAAPATPAPQVRGVDPMQQLGPLPAFVQPVAQRIQALPDVPQVGAGRCASAQLLACRPRLPLARRAPDGRLQRRRCPRWAGGSRRAVPTLLPPSSRPAAGPAYCQ